MQVSVEFYDTYRQHQISLSSALAAKSLMARNLPATEFPPPWCDLLNLVCTHVPQAQRLVATLEPRMGELFDALERPVLSAVPSQVALRYQFEALSIFVQTRLLYLFLTVARTLPTARRLLRHFRRVTIFCS